jgi:alanine-glyoxylate transaminase/(R)-3-amino-2-methylpropionate-pyruvate transaminase
MITTHSLGFGRMGTKYWAFEMYNVTPDIIVTAKGLGNGFPIAAVAAKREIAESMSKKSFFNTYGGNPTMTRVAREVLAVIDDEKIQQNALHVGGAFKKELQRLQQKYPIVGDVRGFGLMMGIEIVKDKKTKEPGTELAIEAFEKIRDEGVIMGKGGMYGNVLRVMPPMCVNMDDVKFTADVLDYVLEQVCKKHNLM